MYLDYEVRIPDSRHGITRKPTRGITYIYYAYDRKYSSEKHYTVPKNTTIGKCLDALNQETIESYFSGSSHVNGRSPVLCKKSEQIFLRSFFFGPACCRKAPGPRHQLFQKMTKFPPEGYAIIPFLLY